MTKREKAAEEIRELVLSLAKKGNFKITSDTGLLAVALDIATSLRMITEALEDRS